MIDELINKDKLTYGIVGVGIVGWAAKQYFKEAKLYDINGKHDTLEDVLACDVIMFCLPTPYDTTTGSVSVAAFDEILAKMEPGKVAMLKSTIPVGTSQQFASKYPHLFIFHNPEFLTERYAAEDFSYPDKQVIGITNSGHMKLAHRLMADLPYGHRLITTANTSELMKYALNNFYAMKVSWANQIFDLAEKLEANYEDIYRAFVFDKRICPSHLEINFDNYRGYGGSCLPKDVKALIKQARAVGVPFTIMESVDAYNTPMVDPQHVRGVIGQ